MDCRAVMAVMVDKRMKDAATVQEALAKNGCVINIRLGLHEIRNVCADEGLILLYLFFRSLSRIFLFHRAKRSKLKAKIEFP